jgi:hypothetical protein
MRECEFSKILSKADTDPSMDQRIKEQLISRLDNQIESYKNNKERVFFSLFHIKNILVSYNPIAKVALFLVLITLAGTATVWAANYLVKTYHLTIHVQDIKELDTSKNTNELLYETKKRFGEYIDQTIIRKDAKGNILPPDEESKDSLFLNNYDPIKAGNEAFEQLDFPNLTPTYLIDYYKLDTRGYCYLEQHFKDSIKKSISTLYMNGGKAVNLYFSPMLDASKTDTVTYIMNIEGYETDKYTKSSYTNKNGIICNLIEYENMDVFAEIHFKSDTLGDGSYSISFVGITMDEIEEILDSIPITNVKE